MSDDPIKDALHMIPYGFYVLTSRNGDDRNAMVLNWFTQVSFEPRLVAVGLDNKAYSLGLVREGGAFVLHIFRAEDAEIVKQFSKSRAKNPEKFAAAKYSDGSKTGLPIIKGAAAYLECRVAQEIYTGGSHTIFIAKVVGASVNKPGEAANSLTLSDVGWNYAG